jgi:hypothetical protein
MTLTKPKKRGKTKTLSQLKKQAWVLLSQCIRQEASLSGHCFCYTCRKVISIKEAQASHAIGGRHNAVLFDEEIIRTCCVGCNIFLRGNYPVFVTRLIEENGFAWWQEKLAASRVTIKYDRSMLEFKINSYRERLRALEG